MVGNVVAYLRVGTVEQAESNIPLKLQREMIERFAHSRGLTLDGWIEDLGFSAKDQFRPGLVELKRRMDAREVDGVVIFGLDRLSRSIADWDHLVATYFGAANPIKLFSVTEPLDSSRVVGRLVLEFFRTLADWERDEREGGD